MLGKQRFVVKPIIQRSQELKFTRGAIHAESKGTYHRAEQQLRRSPVGPRIISGRHLSGIGQKKQSEVVIQRCDPIHATKPEQDAYEDPRLDTTRTRFRCFPSQWQLAGQSLSCRFGWKLAVSWGDGNPAFPHKIRLIYVL